METYQAGTAGTLLRCGVTVDRADVIGSRTEIFADMLGIELSGDVDPFDELCDFIVVVEVATGKLVASMRVRYFDGGAKLETSYFAMFFCVKSLLKRHERMMELGRICVHPDHRDGAAVMLLLQEMGYFATDRNVDILFGCTTLPGEVGTDEQDILAYLRDHHAVEDQDFNLEAQRKEDAYDSRAINISSPQKKLVLPKMPSIAKWYTSIKASFGYQAVFDPKFRTRVVATFVWLSKLHPQRLARIRRPRVA